jgi:hypothetical protein
VLECVRALIAETPELAAHEEVRMPYVTRAYWIRSAGFGTQRIDTT